MSINEIDGAIHNSASTLPVSGRELYLAMAPDGYLSNERLIHPERAMHLDEKFSRARQAYLADPSKINLRNLRQSIGYLGAFNLIDEIRLVKQDGTEDSGYKKMRLGPNAATQVLEIAAITDQDKILEMFSGGGYFTFFLSLSGPDSITGIDLFTPGIYDLNSTSQPVFERMFSRLPDQLRPQFTSPNIIQADCTNLPRLNTEFNKIFLHPPFGKASREIVDLSESEAFILWLESLISAYETIGGNFETFSVVPSEWTDVIDGIIDELSMGEVIQKLEEKIKDSEHYRPIGTTEDMEFIPEKREAIRGIFTGSRAYKLNSNKLGTSLLVTSKSTS